MQRILLVLLVLIISALASYGQVMIDNFDSPTPDSSSVHWLSVENPTVLTLTLNPTDKVEGTGSMNTFASLAALHQWGTFAQFGYTLPDSVAPWDWSLSDSLSIWLKVTQAPTHPEYMVFRIHIADRPNPSDANEEWVYENVTILDNVTPGWVNLRVPLFDRVSTGTEIPDSTGFIMPPTTWNFTKNNQKFDRDKIVGWSIALVTSGWDASNPLPADSIRVQFDQLERFGLRAVPFIVFNGRVFPPPVAATSPWAWGQSSAIVEEGAGPVPNSNAIKWTQGDEWANGWTGWGVDIDPAFNLAGGWGKDSLKFKMKAQAGVGQMRAQFESGPVSARDGKRGYVFTPIADSTWHSYAFALKDFVDKDGAVNFDSSAVNAFGIMAEGTGIAGKIVYITELWTGNPEIDVIPPDPPTGLAASGASFVNLITWNDVPNEPGVRYNVYFSDKPWTATADPAVEDLPPYNLPSALATHLLRAPVTDQNVSLYYGVEAKDAAGNASTPTILTTATTTMAKGVPTISMTPPASFVADGNLSEWSGIAPFNLSVVSGTAHAVPNFPITDDADLHVKAYLAVDASNLYVAFDVDDDIVAVDTAGTDYEQDCPDLFIGMYDWRGKHHKGYGRGTTPDYHIRFSKHRIRIDNDGGATVMHISSPSYAWEEKILTSGYTVEAKIPFTELAAALVGKNDAVFVPVEGKRIPIDFGINDRDANTTRSGIMCYSALSNDDSYKDMFYWTYTWLGNKAVVSVEQTDQLPLSYSLSQNYPNPFNPSTRISYTVLKAGYVSLKVYDVMGREVATLVNQNQDAGGYQVTFNSTQAGLASGVYFYRLEAGSFVATQKMMLLK